MLHHPSHRPRKARLRAIAWPSPYHVADPVVRMNPARAHPLSASHFVAMVRVVLLAAFCLVQPGDTARAIAAEKSASARTSHDAVTVGKDVSALPVPVRDMRDGILAAVRSGDLKELAVVLQWNELPPDLGIVKRKDLLTHLKQQSVDGEGLEILAILGNLLSTPYAIVREGRDIENNQVFIWPYLARKPFAKLSPTEQVLLLSLISRDAFKRTRETGQYSYWSIAIGADGTWHSFKQPPSPARTEITPETHGAPKRQASEKQ